MTDDELKKIRGYYHSLVSLEPVFESSSKTGVVRPATVGLLSDELIRIEREFPSLLPQFDLGVLKSRNGEYFYAEGIRSVLALALGRLKVAIESSAATPVTQHKDFISVRDPALRSIVERDYVEIQKAFVSGCWKSVIILAGGVIEAVLIDQLQRKVSLAKSSPKAPKGKEIGDWGLVHLILVSADLKLVPPGLDKLSHSIREYRDLVHPTVEVHSGLKISPEEARIAIEVLNILHRDLSGHS